MIEKVRDLIEKEDIKKPLTDQEIAQKLHLHREEVTNIRNQLNIPDSRKRLRKVLMKEVEELLVEKNQLSDRGLTRELQARGYSVSRHVVKELRRKWQERKRLKSYKDSHLRKSFVPINEGNARLDSNEPPGDRGVTSHWEEEHQAFVEVIGAEGSLKPYIKQAKAAVLYPPHGLHTLLLGATGVGKSQLAEAMYFFAIEVERLKPDAPFVVFNCADYAENPQLLMTQLFGSIKGAFTGADRERQGLIEQADGGILFLDEVHRLPPEGQELLFYIIDKGKFRRLGETGTYRNVDLMIICATTESPESSLLITFRRRIPMIIELPSLNERPLSERYEIILQSFHKESNRTGAIVRVQSGVIYSLLTYDCPGNIGQLRSDIQVACARAFLRYVTSQQKEMIIQKKDLPEHVERRIIYNQNENLELDRLASWDFTLSPNQENHHTSIYENLYSLPDEIYHYIENRYLELSQQGESKATINRIIGEELEYRFTKMMRHLEEHTKPMARKDLVKIVGVDVAEAVEKMVWIAEQQLQKNFQQLYYGLAIHVHTTLERIKRGKPIINPRLDQVREDNPVEFRIAQEMANVINHAFQVDLPEDEVGFIAMYLRQDLGPKAEQPKVGIVVISHGNVAGGMAEVANRLNGVNHARAVEMLLDESPKTAYERTLTAVREADEGKGVLLLADMGSLIQFGDKIMEETGIPVKTLHGTSTILVIESVRKAMLPDNTLDQLVDSLDQDITFSIVKAPERHRSSEKKRTILTTCISGHGAAVKIKENIEKKLPQLCNQIEIIPVPAISEENKNMMFEFMNRYRVIAVVGTVDPRVPAVPFISIEEITTERGLTFLERLIEWSLTKQSLEEKQVVHSTPDKEKDPSLTDLLNENIIFMDSKYYEKENILEFLSKKLYFHGYVTKDYYQRVLERERMDSPVFPPDAEAAIPHADPMYVRRPVIAVLILNRPVYWGHSREVKYVFMLALKENCGRAVQELYHAVRQETVKQRLNSCSDPRQVIHILTGAPTSHI